MLLGGFLKQMNDTIKYNMSLLSKRKRKPFEKPERYRGKVKRYKLIDSIRMTYNERARFLNELKEDTRRTTIKQIFVLLLSVTLALILLYIFNETFVDDIIQLMQ